MKNINVYAKVPTMKYLIYQLIYHRNSSTLGILILNILCFKPPLQFVYVRNPGSSGKQSHRKEAHSYIIILSLFNLERVTVVMKEDCLPTKEEY